MNFSHLAAFGPFGTPELIILAILFAMVAVPLAAVIAVVIFLARKKSEAGNKEVSSSTEKASVK